MKIYFYRKCCEISNSYIESLFDNNDFCLSELEEADLIIYVGCAYTKVKIDNSLEDINTLKTRKKDNAKIGIFGCVTKFKEFYDIVKTNDSIDYIGSSSGEEMQQEITDYINTFIGNKEIKSNNIGYYLSSAKRINIIVQDGCNNRCAFCKSNYLNLHLKSKPMEKILELICEANSVNGTDEVNIMGLNPTQYGIDLYGKKSLTELIQKISSFDFINTILLDMLCIQDITSDLLNEIISNPKIKRVMIPIQSLDDRLLTLMNRKNTSLEAERIIELISSERPDIILETIFLACYPTETDYNIKKNIEFLKNYNILNPVISCYKYGYNVKSLKSENIIAVSDEEYQLLLLSYYVNVVPIIEEQRRKLLSKPVLGRLMERDQEYDYYTTLYRFCAYDYIIRCKKDENIPLYSEVLLETDFLPSKDKTVYQVCRQEGNGKVLKRLFVK